MATTITQYGGSVKVTKIEWVKESTGVSFSSTDTVHLDGQIHRVVTVPGTTSNGFATFSLVDEGGADALGGLVTPTSTGAIASVSLPSTAPSVTFGPHTPTFTTFNSSSTGQTGTIYIFTR